MPSDILPKKSLTLIKLGGSIITHKSEAMVVRRDVLHRLVAEISRAIQDSPNDLIVAHGQGSFAHVPAQKYQTMDGFIMPESRIGMAITQDQAAQLNRIVVADFIAAGLPAVSLMASNTLVAKERQEHSWSGQVLREYLSQGLLPVTCGDVIVDAAQGCTIWSAEKVLGQIVRQFQSDERYEVTKVIHVTEVDGVLDHDLQIITKITPDTMVDFRKMIGATKGFDVTGGMAHKLEESLMLAKKGIDVYILSGLAEDNLYHALTGTSWKGTLVTRD